MGIVLRQAELDTLPFKGAGIGLDLHVLFQQPVNGFLGFVKLHGDRRLCMQCELLLYRFSQVPAEKHQGVATMAFGMQKSPGLLRCVSQNIRVNVRAL